MQIQTQLNGVSTTTKYSQVFSALNLYLQNGNDNIVMNSSVNLNTAVSGGFGNDNVQLGGGNDTVTLGDGNDMVLAGNGNDILTMGNGNDKVTLGNGNDLVVTGWGNDNLTLGNGNDVLNIGKGNDNLTLGNGSDVVGAGSGNDNIVAGNGNDLIVAGLGHHSVQVGIGNDILIDGNVALAQTGDSLAAVLHDWTSAILAGRSASQIHAALFSRLLVTYNVNPSQFTVARGGGLDWVWYTDTKDTVNLKPTDLHN